MSPTGKILFEDAYTELQCLIMAQINRFNIEGISATQYNILDYLIRNGAGTTSQLAAALHITPAAISRQMKKLLEEGYVKQERDTADRRNYFHEVTATGSKVVEDATRLRQTMAAGIRKALTKAELQSFTQLCHKIVQKIKV